LTFAALPQHSAESLRLSGRPFPFFEAMPQKNSRHSLFEETKMNGKPQAYRTVLRQSRQSGVIGPSLDVVVHRELERVRPQAQRLNFALALITDPPFNHSRRKHVTLQQKLVVVFQGTQ
jgi:hypothetical protein